MKILLRFKEIRALNLLFWQGANFVMSQNQLIFFFLCSKHELKNQSLPELSLWLIALWWQAGEAAVTAIKLHACWRGFVCSSGPALTDCNEKLAQRFQFCHWVVLLGIHGCFYDISKQTQTLDMLACPRCRSCFGSTFSSQVTDHYTMISLYGGGFGFFFHLHINTYEFDLNITICTLSLFI